MRATRKYLSTSVVVAALALGCAVVMSAKSREEASYPQVSYPVGYRSWTHVKSNLIGPKSALYKEIGGYQHIYANEKGMDGYRTGRFPEGSVLIYDFLEGVETDSGSTIEGPRRFTSVMVKDSKRYAATGGWGYEEWRGDSTTDRMIAADAATKCFACHQNRADHDYVFSTYRK